MTFHAKHPTPRPGGRRPGIDRVEQCNVILKVTGQNTHLKTKTHWVLGWVPPEEDGGQRTFYAGRKWTFSKGGDPFVRYWGYAEIDGRKCYGWIDEGTYRVVRGKKASASKKPKSYDAYKRRVNRMMKAAWRYRNTTKLAKELQVNKRPVRARLPSPETQKELPVYRNPWEDGTAPKTPDAKLRRSKKAGGFVFSVRWAKDDWILINAGTGNEGWVFIKAAYKDIRIINPVKTKIKDGDDTREVMMTRKVHRMNRAEIKSYARKAHGP